MQKGDIVLIIFPFTDLSGNKLRPALVIAETPTDVISLFITAQLKWREVTDVILIPDNNNGIKKQSLLRISKIATLDKRLVKGRLGSVSKSVQQDIDINLKEFLQISWLLSDDPGNRVGPQGIKKQQQTTTFTAPKDTHEENIDFFSFAGIDAGVQERCVEKYWR